MATVKDIEAFLNKLDSDFVRRAVPRIVAEKATVFYKERFVVKKDPEGNSWPNTKRPVKKGSLMVRSGALQSTVKPSVTRPDLVRISAGSGKVAYAQAHNEGADIVVTEKMKRFFWAKHIEAQGGQTYSVKTKGVAKTAKNKQLSGDALFYKGMALKKVGSTITIQKRQFMGKSSQLNTILLDSFKKAFKGLF